MKLHTDLTIIQSLCQKVRRVLPYSSFLLIALILIYILVQMLITYQEVSQSKRSKDTVHQLSKKWNVLVEINSLPVYRPQSDAWYFTVEIQKLLGKNKSIEPPSDFPKIVRLAWYQPFGGKNSTRNFDFRVPKISEKWHLWIKLKAIHSQVNPSSFDYERWAFIRHIENRGYVLNSSKNKQYKNYSLESQQIGWVSQWRSYLRVHIENISASKESKALLKALMIGDKSSLSQTQWDAFRDAGIAHLLVISGLHIGLVALFMGWLWSRLWRFSARLCQFISAPYIWFVGGMLSATMYALIAGFEIPVQRALVMLFVTFLALLYKRYIPNLIILFCAFIAVMLFDVRSFYATGFWLSFMSVALILLLLRSNEQERSTIWTVFIEKNAWMHKWQQMKQTILTVLKLQLAITICLIPMLLFFFQTASVVAPIANLTITPIIGTIIIPPIIIAVFLSFSPGVFNFLLELIGLLLGKLNDTVLFIIQWLDFRIQLPSPMLWVTIVSTLLLLFFFLCTNWKKRVGALGMVIILLFPYPINIPKGVAQINVLDVGQGLSIVVFTRGHSLIYDFGNRSLGRSVVYPFMNANVREADKVIISHHDIDHYGGSDYVLSKYPKANQINWTNCSGEWYWDEVRFQLWQYPAVKLSSLENPSSKKSNKKQKIKDNNLSCVLKITAKNSQSFLATGDIEKKAEKWFVKNIDLTSDVLLVPHQGSKTSSTQPFIQAVNPKLAIVSAGYQNHFKHPHPQVIQRYTGLEIPVYGTACSGMIRFKLGEKKNISEKSIYQHRKENDYFWLRQC